MTAIGIGWGIGWLPYSADYSRFVPRHTSRRRLFFAASLGQFVPVMWLGVLGASIATTGTGADPAVIIVQTFGALSIPVLLLVIHGPIATNILNVYSMSVAALALDVKVPRHILSVVVGVVATAFTIVLVFAGDIATNVDSWLAGVVAWVSPWAAIMFVHYYVIRRQDLDVAALYQPPRESRVGDVNWAAVGVARRRPRRHLDVPLRAGRARCRGRSRARSTASTCRGRPACWSPARSTTRCAGSGSRRRASRRHRATRPAAPAIAETATDAVVR